MNGSDNPSKRARKEGEDASPGGAAVSGLSPIFQAPVQSGAASAAAPTTPSEERPSKRAREDEEDASLGGAASGIGGACFCTSLPGTSCICPCLRGPKLPPHITISEVPPGTPEHTRVSAPFGPGFDVVKIVEVKDALAEHRFRGGVAAVYARQRERHGDAAAAMPSTKHMLQQLLRQLNEDEAAMSYPELANVTSCLHTTKASALLSVLSKGLDPRLAKRGFFGQGLYFTEDPMKANDYSEVKGDPHALRIMLWCQIVRGHAKAFEVGRFDRDLVIEPEGFDSVEGFIRRGTEYVVYGADRAIITHVIIYRMTDTQLETTPSFALPPGVSGQIVYITASLSEFFGKLQQRATQEQQVPLKRLIASLLKRNMTVQEFLAQVSNMLKAAPPADLEQKLTDELAKCKLPPGLTPAPTTAPAPALPPLPMFAPAPAPVQASVVGPSAAATPSFTFTFPPLVDTTGGAAAAIHTQAPTPHPITRSIATPAQPLPAAPFQFPFGFGQPSVAMPWAFGQPAPTLAAPLPPGPQGLVRSVAAPADTRPFGVPQPTPTLVAPLLPGPQGLVRSIGVPADTRPFGVPDAPAAQPLQPSQDDEETETEDEAHA